LLEVHVYGASIRMKLILIVAAHTSLDRDHHHKQGRCAILLTGGDEHNAYSDPRGAKVHPRFEGQRRAKACDMNEGYRDADPGVVALRAGRAHRRGLGLLGLLMGPAPAVDLFSADAGGSPFEPHKLVTNSVDLQTTYSGKGDRNSKPESTAGPKVLQ